MTDQEKQASNNGVFISYSRKNKEFVRKLNDALDASGFEAWVDWEGIPPSADWMDEIARAVETSDAFVFVISKDSLASEVCGNELALAIKYNKKLIPVLHIEPERGTPMPEKISSHNWVYMRDDDDFDAGIAKILESLNTDLDWLRQHTRLLQRAREWERKNHNNSFLLQGSDLEDAESWRSKATAQEDRDISPLQGEYIDASRKAASLRQRNLLIGVSLALVISVALAIYAVFQSNLATQNAQKAADNAATAVANEHLAASAQADAEANAVQARQSEALAVESEQRARESENQARAQRSAALAQIYQSRTGELFTSTLLAIDSWEREQTIQAEDILRQNLSQMPSPIAQVTQNGRINNLEFSPDNSHFVAASSGGAACVWNAADGNQLFCENFGRIVTTAFFIDDGQSVIAASLDGSVRLLTAETGELIKRYDFDSPVPAIATTPDATWLAVGLEANRVEIINLKTDRSPYVLGYNSPVTVTRFSPDGNWLAVGLADGSVHIWLLNSETYILGPKHNSTVFSIEFSPDSQWLVSVSEDSTARVAQTRSGQQRHVLLHDDWLEDVAFGPSSDWFVTVADDYTVRVWDTKSGQEKVRMLQEGFTQEVKVSPNGDWIASTGWDYTVRIWNTNTGSERIEIPLESYGSALAFSSDGNKLLVGARDGNISVWDISLLSTRINYLDFPELLHLAIFSPNGEWLAANSDDYKVWLLTKNQWLSSHSGTTNVISVNATDLSYYMTFSPDSRWLAVAEGENSKVFILYDVLSKKASYLSHGDNITRLAFSPDSSSLAVVGENKLITIWDTATGIQTGSIQHDKQILSVAYSPDDKFILTGQEDAIVVWDLATQSIVTSWGLPGHSITEMKFNHAGTLLATSSTQGVTFIWNFQNEQPDAIAEFQQNGQSLSIDFSPDNTLLAIGGAEGIAYLIDLSTYKEIARIPHVVEVSSVSFSSDGAYLATVSRKGVQIWEVAKITPIMEEDLITTACSRMTYNLDESQWAQLFYTEPFRRICPNLPLRNE